MSDGMALGNRRVVLAGLVAGCLTLASAVPARVSAQQRSEIDALRTELKKREFQTFRLLRFVLPDSELDGLEQSLARRAKAAGLTTLEFKHVPGRVRMLLDDRRPSPLELYRIDVSGRDEYGKFARFLELFGTLVFLRDVQTLRFQARANDDDDDDDEVSFAARLVFPVYAGPLEPGTQALPTGTATHRAQPSPTPGSSSARPKTPDERAAAREKQILDSYIADLRARLSNVQLLGEKLVEMGPRTKPSRPVRALSRFMREAAEQPMALSEVRFDGEMVLKGVISGGGARVAVVQALDNAGLQLVDMKTSKVGVCQWFSMTVRLGVDDPPSEGVTGPDAFDGRIASLCNAEPEPPAGHVVARTEERLGPVTLHLRDTDLVDVFYVLHGATSESFVVDSDVKGRVSVDFDGVTVDDALVAMRTAGVLVGPGPLRRVSRAEGRHTVRAAEPTSHGEHLVSVSFRRADLRDVVCLFGTLSQREVWSTAQLEAQVSIFAREQPWDQTLEAIAASAGLVSVVEKDRVFVGSETASRSPDATVVDPCEWKGRSTSRSWTAGGAVGGLGIDDLEWAGLGHSGAEWKAYAYGPMRVLHVLEPGQVLFGARVVAVGRTGMRVRTDDGKMVDVSL